MTTRFNKRIVPTLLAIGGIQLGDWIRVRASGVFSKNVLRSNRIGWVCAGPDEDGHYLVFFPAVQEEQYCFPDEIDGWIHKDDYTP